MKPCPNCSKVKAAAQAQLAIIEAWRARGVSLESTLRLALDALNAAPRFKVSGQPKSRDDSYKIAAEVGALLRRCERESANEAALQAILEGQKEPGPASPNPLVGPGEQQRRKP